VVLEFTSYFTFECVNFPTAMAELSMVAMDDDLSTCHPTVEKMKS
jgi:hypothetical protein